ncbi:MAG: 5-(carboxyamino)imidazole ribonucleotide synthase [Methylococcales bacterium]|jgi:5-(carboxyamino)imidazole ribonucleotide synthase|nr:5-(carboxyamino)imidazole ribonucleotide synthase [Methylococcales bacterium]MBT7445603.1 5-(carboxyamino)imidazole ribonucleotide synthase [Methylococcales bacterium]
MILPANTTLGMIGGGQLGQMFTFAAKSMGYKVLCFEPADTCPTADITEHLSAQFDDKEALKAFAERCDAITLEFENIPVSTVEFLEQFCPVHPSSKALAIAQNRILEKNHIQSTGLQTANFAVIETADDLASAWSIIQQPSILKISTLGYDGKGQIVVEDEAGLQKAFDELEKRPCVLEERVALAKEISVVLCRNAQGEIGYFPIAENIHINGILDTTIAPARVSDATAEQARQMATQLANSLDYVGVLAVEIFVTEDGRLLINEMAPRPHNSGHFTMDACLTSQFQQQARMMCGLPPGSTKQHTPAVMKNLLGDVWHDQNAPYWQHILQHPTGYLHLYGKAEARIGRKMGHFTVLDDTIDTALSTANTMMSQL